MAQHRIKTMFSKMFQYQAESGALKNVTNLVVGAPGPDLLAKSRDIMCKAAVAAMNQEEPGNMFQYGPPAGDPVFLNGVKDLLEAEYGEKRNIENLLCTSGATAGLNLIASTLMTRDCVVFLEDPTYFIAINMLRNDMGIPVVSVATDEAGICVDALRAGIRTERERRGTKAAGDGDKYWAMLYLVPTFHNPTGKNMTPERIEEVIAVAREEGLLIVCDDVYNLLYYSPLDKPLKRMQDYEKTSGQPYETGVVLSNNTFAKILGPGLRVGWIEGPTSIVDRITGSNFIRSAGSPNHFTSIALGYALESGGQSEMLRTLRTVNGERMRAACEELRNLPEGSSFDEPQGGYFIWVRFPEQINVPNLIATLKEEHQVVIPPGAAFSADGNFANCTRISIAFHSEHDIRNACQAICLAAKQQLGQ